MVKIRKLDEAVTIFSVPFNRFNLIPVGGRSTAVKLASGNVVLFASSPNDAESVRTLKAMGTTVTHIIALDAVHHLFLGHFKEEFPHAKLVGPKGLVDKRKDLKFDIVLPDAPLDSELSAEFRAIPLTGHPNEDIVWYHRPSKTVIEADALFNLVSADQKTFTPLPEFMLRQMSPNTAFHRLAVSAFSKAKGQSREFTEAAREIAALDMKRLIPCHGEVLEGPAANKGWRDAYRAFLGEDQAKKST